MHVSSLSRGAPPIADDRILDSAFELLMAIGLRRMTMSDVARQAGVSRATLYRRWKDVGEVVRALITREWARLANDAFAQPADHARQKLVQGVVQLTRGVRSHPIQRKIIEVDPEFFLPYIVRRRGRSLEIHLKLIRQGIRAGVADGSIEARDIDLKARTVQLTASSFVLHGPVITGEPSGQGPQLDALDEQLYCLLDHYLAHDR